jgi:hypothetical protein
LVGFLGSIAEMYIYLQNRGHVSLQDEYNSYFLGLCDNSENFIDDQVILYIPALESDTLYDTICELLAKECYTKTIKNEILYEGLEWKIKSIITDAISRSNIEHFDNLKNQVSELNKKIELIEAQLTKDALPIKHSIYDQ